MFGPMEAIVFIMKPANIFRNDISCFFGEYSVNIRILDQSCSCVRPTSQNPYPIYDQNLWFSLPYLWPDQKIDTLF